MRKLIELVVSVLIACNLVACSADVYKPILDQAVIVGNGSNHYWGFVYVSGQWVEANVTLMGEQPFICFDVTTFESVNKYLGELMAKGYTSMRWTELPTSVITAAASRLVPVLPMLFFPVLPENVFPPSEGIQI